MKDSRRLMMHSIESDEEKLLDDDLNDVVSLAKKALSASKEAASIVDLLLNQPSLDAPIISSRSVITSTPICNRGCLDELYNSLIFLVISVVIRWGCSILKLTKSKL